MRALKTLIIILGAVLGIGAVMYAMGDPDYRVERAVVIDAPPGSVFGHVSTLAAMDKWSPWNEKDPNMKKSMEGTDGTVGAKAMWEGNSDVGKGTEEIAAIVPNERIVLNMVIEEPFAGISEAQVVLTPEGEGTNVTWLMTGTNEGFLNRAMSVIFNTEKMVGPEFEKGLGYLKQQAEAAYAEEKARAAAAPAFEITTTDRPAMLYIGKREVVKWADMKDYYGKNFGAGMGAAGKAGVQPAGPPSGIYFEWNEKDMTADMIAGIPVAADAKAKLKGVDLYEAPASKALVIDYYGGYNGIGKAHEAMDAYLKANTGMVHHTNAIEEYITDPGSEPDSTKWLTKVIYLVK